MEAFIVKNKEKIIENAIFSFWPLVSLLVARRGLRTWLKFEIFTTLLRALILIFSPATLFKNANWINVCFFFRLPGEFQLFFLLLNFCLSGVSNWTCITCICSLCSVRFWWSLNSIPCY